MKSKCILLVIITCFIFAKGESKEHLLSFIIPCYNCEKWIEETIDSIYSQYDLEHPFEIVCTDDGSSDSTYQVLCNLAEKHPELRIYRHLRNQGGSLARNTCVYHTAGDLIFCLDSDNVLCENSVQELIDYLDDTGADVVSFGGIRYFSESYIELGSFQYYTASGYYDLKEVLECENTPPWSGNYLYTKESFDRAGGYPPRLTTDTFSFGFKQVLTGSIFTYLPGTYYWHRVGIESYYLRESRTNRIGIDFFDTILAIRSLIKEESCALIEVQRENAINGVPYVDQIEILEKKLIKLK